MKTILVVEDDPAILRGLQELLTAEHFHVLTAPTGTQGLMLGKKENLDLIILDLGLPDVNGEDVCKQLREAGVPTPLLMLTSKSQEMDKVLGLEMGADDYMTKPFSVRELLARIHAILRREHAIKKDLDEYAFGSVVVDFRKQETTRKGKAVKLSVREYAVLKFLILHEGEVVTRDMLLNDVWGYETFPTTRTVDNYILALRKKLEGETTTPRHLLTVHTAGYKFVK
ncbi:MAG: putative phosphate regulon DNA-binding response regulator [Bacteroidetes bacterium]|jgi:DNA-binding response OmpR family regulator|nr:putative phosphate regulon DNA-binding response regulator [Bacteroidota bacterium]